MQRINKLMKHHSVLSGLSNTIAEQRGLLDQIRTYLPESVRPHCLGAVCKDSCLTLFVDSPVWSSRLRYLSKQLLDKLGSSSLRVESIKIRIMLQQTPLSARRKRRQPNRLSENEAHLLRNYADSCDDPALSAALLRLAKNVRKKPRS